MDDELTPRSPPTGPPRGRSDRLFLLRLWRETEPGSTPLSGWRCSLEEPRSGQRRGFASVLELAGYLLRAFGSRGRT